jgi:hypothetical protein
MVDGMQGDQIGRIFAYSAVIFFLYIFISEKSKNLVLLFSLSLSYFYYCINFGTKMDDFFTNSSGHPDFTCINGPGSKKINCTKAILSKPHPQYTPLKSRKTQKPRHACMRILSVPAKRM